MPCRMGQHSAQEHLAISAWNKARFRGVGLLFFSLCFVFFGEEGRSVRMLACCGAQNSKGKSTHQLLESKDGVGGGFLTGTQSCRGDGWLSAGSHRCDMGKWSRTDTVL